MIFSLRRMALLTAAPAAVAVAMLGPGTVSASTPSPATPSAPAAVTDTPPPPQGSSGFTSAAASTPPGTHYKMYDSTCSFGGPCREVITITSNPNNAAVRSWINCYNAIPNNYTTTYGGWHTAVGDTSTTPSCDDLGRSSNAGFQWNKTALYALQCWTRGQSWGPGVCTN